jgi:predicted membrane-bound spermidine synthase
LTAALLGSVLPLLCRLALASDARVGRGVSLVYLSNILGSTIGSLGIGFILMQYFGLRQVSQFLSVVAILTGGVLLFFGQRKFSRPPAWTAVLFVAALVAVPASSPLYFRLFEKLIFGAQGEQDEQFVHIVENRNGVIAVTKDAAVFGSGVYDGFFNIDPVRDVNFVIRAYSLSAFHPAPKHMLMIGLSSGSWGQILANHPQVESLDVVEINPGYLQLIRQYPMVRSLLSNPKVHLYVDDGRRWLLAHPQAHYDVIVTNTTYYWRDHSTGLLSVEYLQLIRKHLNPGGIYYFNTTDSLEVFATALHIYPYGMRVMNFLIVGDSPINVSKENWLAALSRYTIDNKKVFDLDDPAVNKVLGRYMDFADTVNRPRQFMSLESGDSVRRRIGGRQIITDDNMGAEWRNDVRVPWHVATSN